MTGSAKAKSKSSIGTNSLGNRKSASPNARPSTSAAPSAMKPTSEKSSERWPRPKISSSSTTKPTTLGDAIRNQLLRASQERNSKKQQNGSAAWTASTAHGAFSP